MGKHMNRYLPKNEILWPTRMTRHQKMQIKAPRRLFQTVFQIAIIQNPRILIFIRYKTK